MLKHEDLIVLYVKMCKHYCEIINRFETYIYWRTNHINNI